MPGVLISSETGCGSRTTLGLLMLFECMGICIVLMAHESEFGDCLVHMYMVDNLSGFFFSSNPARVHILGLCLALICLLLLFF